MYLPPQDLNLFPGTWRQLRHLSQPNAGFFFAGSENTRDTLLRCWPETLTPAQLNGDNGFCEAERERREQGGSGGASSSCDVLLVKW